MKINSNTEMKKKTLTNALSYKNFRIEIDKMKSNLKNMKKGKPVRSIINPSRNFDHLLYKIWPITL